MTVKVLYVAHIGTTGGASTSLSNLIAAISKYPVDVHVVCPDGPVKDVFRALGCSVYPLASVPSLFGIKGLPIKGVRLVHVLRYLWGLKSWFRFSSLLAEIKPDIVHFNERGMDSFVRLAKNSGAKVIVHARSVADNTVGWEWRRQKKIYATYVDKVVAIDENVSKALNPLTPSEVIENPIEPPVHFDVKHEASPFVVGYLGGLIEAKGIFDLFEAALFLRGMNDISFVVGGSNSRPKKFFSSILGRVSNHLGLARDVDGMLRKMVADYDMGDQFKVVGQVTDKDAFFSSINCLVFPGHTDGVGRSAIEAGIRGIPAIVALETWSDGAFRADETAVVIKPKSPHRLADAIVRLKDDHELRKSISSRMKGESNEKYKPDVVAAKIMKVYGSLMP